MEVATDDDISLVDGCLDFGLDYQAVYRAMLRGLIKGRRIGTRWYVERVSLSRLAKKLNGAD